MQIPFQAKQVVDLLFTLLEDQISGVYLYGSAVLGGLQVNSDVDLLLITREALTAQQRIQLTAQLMKVSGRVGCKERRPIELTILHEHILQPLRFPPRYEYMYGEWLRDELERGMIPEADEDPDVAILLWQARKHSIALYGPPPETLLPEVPLAVVLDAIRQSKPGLLRALNGDERNVLLTLTRMWYTLENQTIASKSSAARWAIARIPHSLRWLMEMASDAYQGLQTDEWSGHEEQVQQVADWLAAQIDSYF